MFEIGGQTYTLGALAMTNFGSLIDLTIAGERIGKKLAAEPEDAKGSCIMVLATDAPLSSRQLSRVARRAQSGLARTGAVTEHGSGEIVLAFSTANRIQAGQIFHSGIYLNDEAFRPIFRAATETVEGEYHPLHAGGRDRHRPRRPHPPVAARCDGKSRSAPVIAE